ncbi:MaoC family dehydratase [Bacillus thermotolerans]|uniref:MaoC family dehydratase n=1 Tax=Bacillus thermotolerans TaxID=1221996 RepID=UPI0005922521|nr:MaoC family dehydratase [Bacillus thermotolerans]KKB44761.1 Acyl dehydratase [Bacillus thermotolerans]
MCVRARCTITITEEKVKQYAALSGDHNPIHFDQEEAKRHGFEAPIAHGMLTMGLAYRIVSLFAEKGKRIEAYDMQFLKPVYLNETIHLTAQQKNEQSTIMLTGTTERGLVVKGKMIMSEE